MAPLTRCGRHITDSLETAHEFYIRIAPRIRYLIDFTSWKA